MPSDSRNINWQGAGWEVLPRDERQGLALKALLTKDNVLHTDNRNLQYVLNSWFLNHLRTGLSGPVMDNKTSQIKPSMFLKIVLFQTHMTGYC